MSLTEIKCSNCNFKLIPDGANIFYLNPKTNELVEYMSLRLSKRDETIMWGHIEKTYCYNCDKLIKTYLIRESEYSKDESIIKLRKLLEKSDFNEKHNIELLIWFQEDEERERNQWDDGEEKSEIIDNEFLEKFRKNENILTIVQMEKYYKSIFFETVDEAIEYEKKVNNSKINCPQCNKQLYRNFHAKKCPLCESELIMGISVDID